MSARLAELSTTQTAYFVHEAPSSAREDRPRDLTRALRARTTKFRSRRPPSRPNPRTSCTNYQVPLAKTALATCPAYFVHELPSSAREDRPRDLTRALRARTTKFRSRRPPSRPNPRTSCTKYQAPLAKTALATEPAHFVHELPSSAREDRPRDLTRALRARTTKFRSRRPPSRRAPHTLCTKYQVPLAKTALATCPAYFVHEVPSASRAGLSHPPRRANAVLPVRIATGTERVVKCVAGSRSPNFNERILD